MVMITMIVRSSAENSQVVNHALEVNVCQRGAHNPVVGPIRCVPAAGGGRRR